MKEFATYAVEATYEKMKSNRHYGFEIFGLDFMID